MEKIRDSHHWCIANKHCYFCGASEIIRFKEHYSFCPECTAIYTFLIIQESNCEHIKDGIPSVERAPWYKEDRDKSTYIYDQNGDDHCSICHKECIADGW